MPSDEWATRKNAGYYHLLADRRLIDKGIEYQHTSREARSVWGRRQHHSAELILRQNIASEVGFAAVGLQNMILKFVKGCEICSIIRQQHPNLGKGKRVPLVLGGKPYDSISIDPITLGQIRLSRGVKNALRKNVVLAVCCLTSGHISLEPLQSLTP